MPTHGTGPKIWGQVPCRHGRSYWSPEVCFFRNQRHAAGQLPVPAYSGSSNNIKDLKNVALCARHALCQCASSPCRRRTAGRAPRCSACTCLATMRVFPLPHTNVHRTAFSWRCLPRFAPCCLACLLTVLCLGPPLSNAAEYCTFMPTNIRLVHVRWLF